MLAISSVRGPQECLLVAHAAIAPTTTPRQRCWRKADARCVRSDGATIVKGSAGWTGFFNDGRETTPILDTSGGIASWPTSDDAIAAIDRKWPIGA